MTITSSLGLTAWAANQNSPEVVVNENDAVGLILRKTAVAKGTSTPPGSPSEGDAYILGASPTGAWSTFSENNVAYYHNGAWNELTAIDGLMVWVDAGSGSANLWRYYSTTPAWVQIAAGTITTREFSDSNTDTATDTFDFAGPGQNVSMSSATATITIPGGPPAVQNITTTNPASLSPADGESWVVAAGATGAWATHDNEIATWTTNAGSPGAWKFTVPLRGWTVANLADAKIYMWSSGSPSAWDAISASGSGGSSTESLIIAVSDETTDLTTGTAKVTFRMPYAFTLSAVRASVTTAPTGATLTVDINESGATILSTKLTIDAGEKTSTTAATAAVISDADLADDAEITVDIDQIGSTVAGAGLKVILIGVQA